MVRDSTRPRRGPGAGSVTLVALCLTTAIGIGIGSYLALCSRSREFGVRQLNLERARELAQAGLEEALWALNQNDWTHSGAAGATAWTTSGANRTASLSYSLTLGTAQVELTVANFASTGPTWPTVTSAAAVTLPGGGVFRKTLQASTAPAPLFGNAIASAESYVSFIAGGTVDSWNSDPDNNPATAAVAYAFTSGNAANYNAVVAGRGTGSFGVALTQATVRGYAATFGLPVSYSTSGSPPGSVVGPATDPGVRVDTGRLGKSAFVPMPPVFTIVVPATTGANFGGIIGNTLALVNALLSAPPETDLYATSGDLTIMGIPLLSPDLTVNRPMRLIVNGDLTISGAGKITVTSTGSLVLFVTGNVNLGGNGVQNLTGDAKKVALFSLAGASAWVRYTSSAGFTGVIYSENCPIDIRQNATFHGALLGRQYVRFSTSATAPTFHYDSALRSVRFADVKTPYVVRGVTEL